MNDPSPELMQLAERIVDAGRAGEAIEAYVARSVSTSVRAYRREVESFTAAENLGAGVRVVIDGRQGFAHCGSHDQDAVASAVAEARDNATYAEVDPYVGLVEPDEAAVPRLDLVGDGVERISADERIERAIELESLVTGADRRITGVRSARYSDAIGEFVIASSNGLRAHDRATSAGLSALALADDGDATTTGAGWDAARDPEDLDVELAARRAVDHAVEKLGATKPDSATLTAVLDPSTTGTFMSIVAGMLSADRVQRQRTPFGDRLGERIGSDLVDLVDDPTNPESLGAERFDGEGLASRPLVLVSDGELRGFAYDGYTARRGGVRSTASAARGARSLPAPSVRALSIGVGTESPDDLIGRVALGVYVTSLTGVHSGVNAVSGDFSVGIEGFMIRDGAKAEPIREATIGGTVQRMLASVVGVASDREWLPSGTGSCTIAVDGVSLSGK